MRTYTLYYGYDKISKELVYIGTTIQKPADRFRWHKANKKDLNFVVQKTFNSSEEMLNEEHRLISIYKPKYNKIINRKQNLNCKLTDAQLSLRKNNKEWCQECLKRRVNTGFIFCFNCSKF